MDKQIKDKWVKALRSGRYKQGINALFDPKNNSHCCLGVLCRVMRLKPFPENKGFYGFGNQCGWLNDEMLKAVDLNDKQQNTLMDLNDRDGMSFREIADYIEVNL